MVNKKNCPMSGFFVKKCKMIEHNKATSKLITLVSSVFNITIEAKHNLGEFNYSNIISIQNFSNISFILSGNILTKCILHRAAHRWF